MFFARIHAHVRAPLALAATLLLAACASTGNTVSQQADGPDDATSYAASQPLSRASAATAAEFKGPQIVFAPNSAELPQSAAPLLDEIAAKLKSDPQFNVMLVGHTEDMGSSEMSVAVSGQCARAVSQALIKRGARASQIRLLASGSDRTGNQRNARKAVRRVDIVMIDTRL